MPDFTYTISPEDKDTRLDHFLVKQFPTFSRSKIQKAVKEGNVMINNEKITPHHFLKEGDVITGAFEIKIQKPELIANKDITVDVIHEASDYLIINKSAGLIVHQSDIHPEHDTLVNGLLGRYPEIKNLGDDPQRPGIVHRLDKEVSGLMVIPRTKEFYDHMKKQFQEGKVYKEYIGIVHGILSHKADDITLSITRSKTEGHKMAARNDGSGRPAKTSYEVLHEGQNYSMVSVVIHTGRTHQIRVHMNAIGHPLVGDQTYTNGNFKAKDVGRILLHAHRIIFTDLEGKEQEYLSDFPDDWFDYV